MWIRACCKVHLWACILVVTTGSGAGFLDDQEKAALFVLHGTISENPYTLHRVVPADIFPIWTVIRGLRELRESTRFAIVGHEDGLFDVLGQMEQRRFDIHIFCLKERYHATLVEDVTLPLYLCGNHAGMDALNRAVANSILNDITLITKDYWMPVPTGISLYDWSCDHGDDYPRRDNKYYDVMTILADCPHHQMAEVLQVYSLGSVMMDPIITLLYANGASLCVASNSSELQTMLPMNVQNFVYADIGWTDCTLMEWRGQTLTLTLFGNGNSPGPQLALYNPGHPGNSSQGRRLQEEELSSSLDSYFHGFGGRRIRVGLLESDPYVMVTEDVNGTRSYTGYCLDLLHLVAGQLDFTVTQEDFVDYGSDWGVKDEHGQWTGSVRGTMEKEVDINIGPITITGAREEVVDFSISYHEEPSAMITLLKPKDPFLLFKPLHPYVWLCFMSLSLIVALILPLLERAWKKISNKSSSSLSLSSFMTASWYTFGACFAQGGVYQPSSCAGKIIISFFWVVAIVVLMTFSANLVAFLAVTHGELPFKSLEDVANDNDYILQVPNNTLPVTLLKESDGGVYARLWEKLMKTPDQSFSPTLTGGLDVMFSPGGPPVPTIYTADLSVLVNEARHSDQCHWGVIPEFYFPSGYGLALPQHTPFKTHIDETITKLLGHGIITKLEKQYLGWLKDKSCGDETTEEARKLKFADIWAGLLVLPSGLTIALLILIFEKRGISFTRVRISDIATTVRNLSGPESIYNDNSRP